MAEPKYDYDLVVIGGGSGGLSCSKVAAELGANVAVLDFVKPSPLGTKWGLGGTCVNVGCIPKKLMHTAAIMGHTIKDAKSYGWEIPDEIKHNWSTMVTNVQDHIGSLNWGYRVALRDKNVKYFNEYGSLVDAHTVKKVNKKGVESVITAKYILLATGGRPRYPEFPGAKEYCVTSDDIFSMPEAPGKTLVVGASYVALECAGFLNGIGYDTTVAVRSIFLRGFDQQMANLIGDHMAEEGVKFLRETVPAKVEKLDSGKLLVTYIKAGEELTEEFDTVLLAIGRYPCTDELNVAGAGVNLDKRSGKVITNDADQTSVENIFAIGDLLLDKPELTPMAIQSGRLLAERLFKESKELCDYTNVCTTVFTPLEYGCCGMAEEDAIKKFGEENLEVYHQEFTPLEYTVPHRKDRCYCKIICNKKDNMRIVGFHICGPNAGEVTQGFGLAFRLKATKDDFDKLVGIHPTVAEVLTTLKVTKASGKDVKAGGC